MKPKWEDAPDWADYLAQDLNGEWWWYERKPHYLDSLEKGCSHWSCLINGGHYQNVEISDINSININWRDTLEQRPTNKTEKEKENINMEKKHMTIVTRISLDAGQDEQEIIKDVQQFFKSRNIKHRISVDIRYREVGQITQQNE